MDALLRAGEYDDFVSGARTLGHLLYRTFCPQELRAWFGELDGPLPVQAAGYPVPWELAHDGREFSGARHALARGPLPRAGGSPPIPNSSGRPRVLVIGTDPDGTLPFLQQEVGDVARFFNLFGRVVELVGSQATLAAVRTRLEERCDFIHVCGAASDGAGGGLDLRLAEGQYLPLAATARSVAGRPLIVLHACVEERGGPTPPELDWEARVGAIATAGLSAGAIWLLADPLRRAQLPALLDDIWREGTTNIRPLVERRLGMGVAELEERWQA